MPPYDREYDKVRFASFEELWSSSLSLSCYRVVFGFNDDPIGIFISSSRNGLLEFVIGCGNCLGGTTLVPSGRCFREVVMGGVVPLIVCEGCYRLWGVVGDWCCPSLQRGSVFGPGRVWAHFTRASILVGVLVACGACALIAPEVLVAVAAPEACLGREKG